jgi:hypothetical protein
MCNGSNNIFFPPYNLITVYVVKNSPYSGAGNKVSAAKIVQIVIQAWNFQEIIFRPCRFQKWSWPKNISAYSRWPPFQDGRHINLTYILAHSFQFYVQTWNIHQSMLIVSPFQILKSLSNFACIFLQNPRWRPIWLPILMKTYISLLQYNCLHTVCLFPYKNVKHIRTKIKF